ncbi:hypothetical protein BY458DRAFT_447164 [Sporodiniella umbellata]|nr:hypothetical protein BY458DRAFT_447164 [Sporodiniella umbellata]
MGCCMSNCIEKDTVYEVVLDTHGVAQRVPKGKGTHFIHISQHRETVLKEKSEVLCYPPPVYQTRFPSLIKPAMYEHRRVQPI